MIRRKPDQRPVSLVVEAGVAADAGAAAVAGTAGAEVVDAITGGASL